jgi:hypothetical protein
MLLPRCAGTVTAGHFVVSGLDDVTKCLDAPGGCLRSALRLADSSRRGTAMGDRVRQSARFRRLMQRVGVTAPPDLFSQV